MDILLGVYHFAMLALASGGILMLLYKACKATKQGLSTLDIAGVIVGCISLGAGLIVWANYLDTLPPVYTAFASFVLGYGGHGVALWNLDPEAAKRLT